MVQVTAVSDADVTEAAQRFAALGPAIRRARGDTPQVDLARALGWSQSVVSMWETGATNTRLDGLWLIEKALGLVPGTICREAGLYSSELPDLPLNHLRSSRLVGVDRACEAIRAAALLGFDVRLRGSTEGAEESVWHLSVLAPPAGAVVEVNEATSAGR